MMHLANGHTVADDARGYIQCSCGSRFWPSDLAQLRDTTAAGLPPSGERRDEMEGSKVSAEYQNKAGMEAEEPSVAKHPSTLSAACTDEDFPEWWTQFGLPLAASSRLTPEMFALAAFSAGKARAHPPVLPSDGGAGRTADEIAEQIIRDHERLCVGTYDVAAPAKHHGQTGLMSQTAELSREIAEIQSVLEPNEKRRVFECLFNFVGWSCLSLGLHLDVIGPHIQVHVPFGFFMVGWCCLDSYPRRARCFSLTRDPWAAQEGAAKK